MFALSKPKQQPDRMSQTLDEIVQNQKAILARLARTETRLVRLMKATGLDESGFVSLAKPHPPIEQTPT